MKLVLVTFSSVTISSPPCGEILTVYIIISPLVGSGTCQLKTNELLSGTSASTFLTAVDPIKIKLYYPLDDGLKY